MRRHALRIGIDGVEHCFIHREKYKHVTFGLLTDITHFLQSTRPGSEVVFLARSVKYV